MALASSVKPSSDYEAKLYGRIYGGDEKKKRAAEREQSATERLERRQLEGKADSTSEISKMLDPRVGGLQSDAPSSDDTDPWEPMGAASSRSRSCNRSSSSCEPDSYSSQGYWHLANDLGYGETWEWMPLVLPRRQEPKVTFEQLQLAFALDSQLQAPLAPPQPPMESCIWRNPLIGKCKWFPKCPHRCSEAKVFCHRYKDTRGCNRGSACPYAHA